MSGESRFVKAGLPYVFEEDLTPEENAELDRAFEEMEQLKKSFEELDAKLKAIDEKIRLTWRWLKSNSNDPAVTE
jgi:hypothetical protein